MTDPNTGESNLLKFMALGRLARGTSGGAIMARDLSGSGALASAEEKKPVGKHQILAYASASKDEKTKQYRKHVKEVMSKGASRLTGGKRVRLLSDEEDGDKYELNVLTEYIDGDPNQALVFFAITAPDFAKHQPISSLFKDFKTGVYNEFDSDTLGQGQSSGPIHSTMKRFFDSLFAKYNRSALANATRKVEQVKEVMKDNVTKALNNVEQLEEMEVKAESMENHAKQFEKRSNSVLWLMRCRYIKITILLALIVLALLCYFIYYIYQKTHVDGPASPIIPSNPSSSTSSSSTGAGR